MKKVLPDTSFLVSCVEFKIDWEKELARILDETFQILILDKVLREIDTVIEKGGRQRRHAKLAKEIIKRRKYKVKKTEKGHTDDILLGLANGFLVATQDTILRRRLKEKGKEHIIIRQKKYLKLIK